MSAMAVCGVVRHLVAAMMNDDSHHNGVRPQLTGYPELTVRQEQQSCQIASRRRCRHSIRRGHNLFSTRKRADSFPLLPPC